MVKKKPITLDGLAKHLHELSSLSPEERLKRIKKNLRAHKKKEEKANKKALKERLRFLRRNPESRQPMTFCRPGCGCPASRGRM